MDDDLSQNYSYDGNYFASAPCQPGSPSSLIGDITVLSDDSAACGKASLGAAGDALVVHCGKKSRTHAFQRHGGDDRSEHGQRLGTSASTGL